MSYSTSPAPSPAPFKSRASLTQKKKQLPLQKNLPWCLAEWSPEAELYNSLLLMEKSLDEKICELQMEIQEFYFRSNKCLHPFRIFSSHTLSSQLFQQDQPSSVSIPSWTFRIEGYLLDTTKGAGSDVSVFHSGSLKFSSFFRSILIEIGRDESLYSGDNGLVEWTKTPLSRHIDGFEVKRHGDTNVSLKIFLVPDQVFEKYRLSEELSSFLNIKTETKASILVALWRYINMKDLYGKEGSSDISNDPALQKLFKCEKMSPTSLPELISGHLYPDDPIVLNYDIKYRRTVIVRIDPLCATGASYVDVMVEVPEPRLAQYFPANSSRLKEIASLESRISDLIHTICIASKRRDYLSAFAQNPKEFINGFLRNHCTKTEHIIDNLRIPYEETRHSEFYRNPWIGEAVKKYLYRS